MAVVTGALSFPGNLYNKLFPPGYTAGARIFSNSWGATATYTYTYYDAEVDEYMADNNRSLIIVAVGNDGYKGTGTVLSPALSKNALSVGASESEHSSSLNRTVVTYFSSSGPTTDGRIKPDVVAPGQVLISAEVSMGCAVWSMMGTSMATPVVAASVAIIRQYFTQGWYPGGSRNASKSFLPTGALMKATIINSAVPMKYMRWSNGSTKALNMPPDNYQGFGRVKLDEVLNVAGSVSLYVRDGRKLAEGNQHVYKFQIPRVDTSIKAFKVTITWTGKERRQRAG